MRSELMMQTAVFGEGGRYRYSLTREWDTRRDQVCWIMLNPSRASAERDDPTIRRCMGFARSWGAGGIVVVNLFALVSTYPAGLLTAADPVCRHNDDAILQAISNRRVICAWGNRPRFAAYDDRVSAVMALLEQTKTPAQCLGLTRFGHPSHPVRLASRKKPRPFEWRKP
jgi:hypothetical protein